ncbi:hypothetical protein L211DRAFT_884893, partial [Terfezia boudieri ATCC MYA-4762]
YNDPLHLNYIYSVLNFSIAFIFLPKAFKIDSKSLTISALPPPACFEESLRTSSSCSPRCWISVSLSINDTTFLYFCCFFSSSSRIVAEAPFAYSMANGLASLLSDDIVCACGGVCGGACGGSCSGSSFNRCGVLGGRK